VWPRPTVGRPAWHVLALAIIGIAGGGMASLAGAVLLARVLWAATTVLCLLPLAIDVARDLARGKTGVDLIALLAMGGALWLGEYLAGAVVAVMLAGGQALEEHATGRARRELTALVSRAPREAHRRDGLEVLDVPLREVSPGDRLLVRGGEVLPVDGVLEEPAVLDESALTGEARPVEYPAGGRVRSGALNGGSAFTMLATASAAASTYAGIVRLVEQADREKAPLVRLADRYAMIFLPLTLAMAVGAWLFSGDPVRALAVLVVATPCPLILAAPIAIVAGISRAAAIGVIVKGGAALETLARGTVLLLDKTGTVTEGIARVGEIVVLAPPFRPDEALRLAASVDMLSPHVLAAAIVDEARRRGLQLSFPEQVREASGQGVEGVVEGHTVRVGRADWAAGGRLSAAAREVREQSRRSGSSAPFVVVDGEVVAALVLEDRLRPDAAETVRELRRLGWQRIELLTGDQRALAEEVGQLVGVDAVSAELSPEEKMAKVVAARSLGVVAMVGDGINDAPALAAADVGIAMGARGATASSEAADVVIVPDRIDRLVQACAVAQRSRRIALQSIVAGMAMSTVGMALAAMGWLPPIAGALAQEGIDLLVILNALRALASPDAGRRSANGAAQPLGVAAR